MGFVSSQQGNYVYSDSLILCFLGFVWLSEVDSNQPLGCFFELVDVDSILSLQIEFRHYVYLNLAMV